MGTNIREDVSKIENALIIINANDIPAAIATADTLQDYKVYIFDPTLLEKVAVTTLRNIHLMNWDNCQEYRELERGSHAAAFEIEKELNLVVSELIPDISLCSWQHLSLYYLFLSLQWYTGLWKEMLRGITNSKFYVFVCDNPSHYYLPSFIPSLLLLEYLTANGLKYSAFSYGERPDDTDIIPNLTKLAHPEHYDILVHIPTCFYDHSYFNDELKCSEKSVINFQSKYWHTPVDALSLIHI